METGKENRCFLLVLADALDTLLVTDLSHQHLPYHSKLILLRYLLLLNVGRRHTIGSDKTQQRPMISMVMNGGEKLTNQSYECINHLCPKFI